MTWQLHKGSCLDALTGLATLADKSVDVTLMDPPYEAEAHTKGVRRKESGGGKGASAYRGVELAPLPFAAITHGDRAAVALHVARTTRRWILVFCQVEASDEWRKALCKQRPQDYGDPDIEYIRTMVWTKPDGQPQFTGDRPGMGYESIVVAHRKGRKRWNGGGRLGVFECKKNAGRPNSEAAPHPTTKPLPLMLELVRLFSDPDETVLDPFAGSGSTGVACSQLGRDFIGWELDANYHTIAERRLRGEGGRINPAQADLFATIGGA